MPGFVQFLHIKMVQPWKAEEALQSDGMNLNVKHNNQYQNTMPQLPQYPTEKCKNRNMAH